MKPSSSYLPYARQPIDDDDIAAVAAVLRSDLLTTGPATEAFEEKLVDVTGADFAVSCSSGTAALHLAAMALDLGPGDSVIVPSITFLATANAVRYTGADVVFADVDADTGLMGPEHLEDALRQGGESLKAVFPVHLGGQSPDMPALAALAHKRGLAIVEDASHAIGAKYSRPRGGVTPVGACADGDMAAFSFHPVKTIAMGEGGAITTNTAALADRLRLLRNHGMTRDADAFVHHDMAFDGNGDVNPWYYEMPEPGYNYRVSDIHCALGLSQLSKLEKFVERRRALAKRYDELLTPFSPELRPVTRMPGGHPAWHLYQVLIDFEKASISRGELMRALGDNGIGSQVHYIPVHHQPYYRQKYGELSLPGADAFYQRCLALPLFPSMGDKEVERVVESLRRIIQDPVRS